MSTTYSPPDLLREKLKDLPDKPGCYLMRDRRGRIIYVGKAISLRRRVQSYFRAATLRQAGPKMRSLVHSVCDLEWIVVRDEAQALLAESQLIKQHRPRYNVVLRDDKRYLAIRGDPREPVPRLTTCRIIRDDGADYFGPFPSADLVRTALDFVEQRYGLRKCAPLQPDAETYRHCHNDIIRFCAAPCIGRLSRAEYLARFDEARAFLRGERPVEIEAVREQMQTAAARQDFEQAARLRDALFALRALARARRQVNATPAMHRADAKHGLDELRTHLALDHTPTVIEAFDISNLSGTQAVASLVCAVEGQPDRRRYRRYRIRTVSGPDDPRMMAEAVGRRYTRLLAERVPLPDLVLVDGGVTQLRAARQVLAGLGLTTLPTAGLTKQFEELVTDDGRPPLRLPPDSDAIRLITRLRDEAHRFAIDYHRALRNRLIHESALDEIPGIGPHRKLLLLKTFGSVRRLARATPEAVAAVPGIGPDLAAAILRAVGTPGT